MHVVVVVVTRVIVLVAATDDTATNARPDTARSRGRRGASAGLVVRGGPIPPGIIRYASRSSPWRSRVNFGSGDIAAGGGRDPKHMLCVVYRTAVPFRRWRITSTTPVS